MRRTFNKRRKFSNRRAKRPFRRTRRFRLRRRTGRPSRKVFRGLGQPDELFITAAFVTERNIEYAANDSISYVSLKLNSLFESDPTQTTNYTTGISQYANFYSKAMVTASKISAMVSIKGNDGTITGSGVYGWTCLIPSINPAPNLIEDPVEQKYHKIQFYGKSESGKSIQKLKHYMTPKKLFGNPISTQPTQYSSNISPAQAGGAQQDPTQTAYWHLIFNNYDDLSTTVATIIGVVKIKITYFVKLYGRIPLSDD